MNDEERKPDREWVDDSVKVLEDLYERYVLGTWTYLTCLPQLIKIGRTSLEVAAANQTFRDELLAAASPELYRPIKVGIASIQTPHSEVFNPWNPRKIDWSFTDEMVAMGRRSDAIPAEADASMPEQPIDSAPADPVETAAISETAEPNEPTQPSESIDLKVPLTERTAEQLAATDDSEFAAFAMVAGLENRTALKREAKRIYDELRARPYDDTWTLLDILYPTAKIKTETAEIRRGRFGI